MSYDIGVVIPEVLLPSNHVELTNWSVVACDQYTSQPNYWRQVNDLVSTVPSTYHITLPEIYLEHNDFEDRIKSINQNMKKYIEDNTLTSVGQCFIYVKRHGIDGKSRKGLIAAVDLEKYDFNKGSNSLIRATEGTVMERLPPRVQIREKAPLELPHIMLLIDDRDLSVIEPLEDSIAKFEKLYDFELMMNSGTLCGYKIDDNEYIDKIFRALQVINDKELFQKKYNLSSSYEPLLFAVGDGNHSLASAKQHWENLKLSLDVESLNTHPARYALVEIVNIHDSGLVFEPIHRVAFNLNIEEMIVLLDEFCKEKECEYKLLDTLDDVLSTDYAQKIQIITSKGKKVLAFLSSPFNLEVGTLQNFLDFCCFKKESCKIDYIHGDEVVEEIGSRPGNIGFFLPPMDKNELFKTVILEGALPRKTFSMGEAHEKRFYLECRKIR